MVSGVLCCDRCHTDTHLSSLRLINVTLNTVTSIYIAAAELHLQNTTLEAANLTVEGLLAVYDHTRVNASLSFINGTLALQSADRHHVMEVFWSGRITVKGTVESHNCVMVQNTTSWELADVNITRAPAWRKEDYLQLASAVLRNVTSCPSSALLRLINSTINDSSVRVSRCQNCSIYNSSLIAGESEASMGGAILFGGQRVMS